MTKDERTEWQRKFLESAWKLTIFITFTLTAFFVSFREKWFWETRCVLSTGQGCLGIWQVVQCMVPLFLAPQHLSVTVILSASAAHRFFWLGCSHFPPCNLTVSKGTLFFYALETGFYIQAIHFLIYYEVGVPRAQRLISQHLVKDIL